jgi:hypothetical protein
MTSIKHQVLQYVTSSNIMPLFNYTVSTAEVALHGISSGKDAKEMAMGTWESACE